jgi:Fur family ferric uptake transcriptional regulator
MSERAPTTTDAATVLAQRGLRVTNQRVVVLEAMMAEPHDITAQALHERLRPTHPQLGMATVYRTLNALADAGALDRLHHDGASTCYRFCAPGHHHHLTCRSCHAVVELHDCDLAPWVQRIAASHGYTDARHSVELSGFCAACAAAGAPDACAHGHSR